MDGLRLGQPAGISLGLCGAGGCASAWPGALCLTELL